MTGVIAFMISQGPNLFEIPPKLATDIRAYWNEKERRKISPTSEVFKLFELSLKYIFLFNYINLSF